MNRCKTAMAGTAVLAVVWVSSASAVDLKRCLAIKDDCRRVACYDQLARQVTADQPAPAQPSAQRDRSDLKARIIRQCEERLGVFGAAMVMSCIEMELPAARELERMKGR